MRASTDRHETFVEAGRRGARKRWAGHTPLVIRLSELTPDQRRAILAYLEVAKSSDALDQAA